MPTQDLSSPDLRAPLLLENSPGTAGQYLRSRGPTLPPEWATAPGGGGGITYTISSTAPSTPSGGDKWYDLETGIEFTWIVDGTSNQWVDLGSGVPGTPGKTILSGAGVPSAGLGLDGDFYINTTASAIYGPKTSGSWGGATSLIGNTGPTGKGVLSGSGVPSAGLGTDGDFYINTAASTIYGPKTGGAWGSPTSLIGGTGPSGPTGPKAITIVSPTSSEKLILFRPNSSITFTSIVSTVIGTTPSVTFSIRYGTDISAAGTEVVTSGITCTNTTTGLNTTSFNNPTVPANNFIWLTTSALSGTVSQLSVSLIF